MMIKKYLGLLSVVTSLTLGGALLVPANVYAKDAANEAVGNSGQAGKNSEKTAKIQTVPLQDELRRGFASNYLRSHFAQSRNDWSAANRYLGYLIGQTSREDDLIKRSMILALGAGEFDTAVKRAERLDGLGEKDSLVLMVLALNALINDDARLAITYLDDMPAGDTTEFIRPLLKGWVLAGDKRVDNTLFNDTPLHQYHKALIALYLDNKEQAAQVAAHILTIEPLSLADKERVGDIYLASGNRDKALPLYEEVKEAVKENHVLNSKLTMLKNVTGELTQEQLDSVLPFVHVRSVQEGAAQAMYDMAYLLYIEQSSTSTRLFSNMALALDGRRFDARLLLADSLVQAGRYHEAIEHLSSIDENHPSYLETQRYIADLMAQMDDMEGARRLLNALFLKYNDVDSLIQIGDLYRQEENYKSALKIYNKAANFMGSEIPEEYWYLLYARGMASEREGNWKSAEADLKAALVYRPNHPYLLNYLGYGWAEQGLELEQSLELIKRALQMRPEDGYITDSLGWVYFMQGQFEQAVPNLEAAVELLPYDSTINDHLGDAYWKVGRTTEARFQWERAVNYATSEDDIAPIERKLLYGLDAKEGLVGIGKSK